MNHGLLAPQFGLGRPVPGGPAAGAQTNRQAGPPPRSPTTLSPVELAEAAFLPVSPANSATSQRAFASTGHDSGAPPNSPAPVVIVKRRKVLAGHEAAEASSTSSAAPSEAAAGSPDDNGSELKESKVFRIDTSRSNSPAPDEPPAGLTPEADPVPVLATSADYVPPSPTPIPRLRRRRNPLHAPTLVQHVVFERPADSEASLPPAGPSPDERLSTAFAGLELLRSLPPVAALYDVAELRDYQEVMASLQRLRRTLAEIEQARGTWQNLKLAMQAVGQRSARRRLKPTSED